MDPIFRRGATSDGYLTRVFLVLIAVGATLMLLSGALLPTDAEAGVPPMDHLRLCMERVLALFN